QTLHAAARPRRRHSWPRSNWPRRGGSRSGRRNPMRRWKFAEKGRVMSADEEREASLFTAPPMPEQERMVEAILFASADPVTVQTLMGRLPHGSDPAEALQNLRRRYEGRGVILMRLGEGWAFRTAPDLGFLMRHETVEMRRLSRAAIETLAIIAYHQPVTRAEIE